MGEAKRRGTYGERKANPTNRTQRSSKKEIALLAWKRANEHSENLRRQQELRKRGAI